MLNKKEVFDLCIREAIEMGREYMTICDTHKTPTQQEWDLALILFQKRINDEKEI